MGSRSHSISLRSLWGHIGITLGSLWNHFGVTFGSRYVHCGLNFGLVGDHFGISFVSCWDHFRIIWESFWHIFSDEQDASFYFFCFHIFYPIANQRNKIALVGNWLGGDTPTRSSTDVDQTRTEQTRPEQTRPDRRINTNSRHLIRIWRSWGLVGSKKRN